MSVSALPPAPFAALMADCSLVELTMLMQAVNQEVLDRLRAQRNPLPPADGYEILDLLNWDGKTKRGSEPTMAALLSRERPLPETPARLRRSSRPPMDKGRLRLVK